MEERDSIIDGSMGYLSYEHGNDYLGILLVLLCHAADI